MPQLGLKEAWISGRVSSSSRRLLVAWTASLVLTFAPVLSSHGLGGFSFLSIAVSIARARIHIMVFIIRSSCTPTNACKSDAGDEALRGSSIAMFGCTFGTALTVVYLAHRTMTQGGCATVDPDIRQVSKQLL